MDKDLIKVSLRQHAIWLPDRVKESDAELTAATTFVVEQLQGCGLTVSEPLLRRLNSLDAATLAQVLEVVHDVMGLDLNWAPLVKNWTEPTGETRADHLVTAFANYMRDHGVEVEGVTLPCGHLIPNGTFHLERYNGCPFCGRPFVIDKSHYTGQGSRLTELRSWGDADILAYYRRLLASPVPLDATQTDSLRLLVKHLPLPDIDITIKETAIIVASALLDNGDDPGVARLVTSPADMLRLLWYRHTGHLQVIEPRTLLKYSVKNNQNIDPCLDRSAQAYLDAVKKLKLHYTRSDCRRMATLLNQMALPVGDMCESMHTKRQMWVRVIRALRLAEHARRPGFEKLRAVLDRFYRHDYTVYLGQVEISRLAGDIERTYALLQERPGTFARCLFANMLYYGHEPTLLAFKAVLDKVPMRLVVTLGMYADSYFSDDQRIVSVITGKHKIIDPNPRIHDYTPTELAQLAADVNALVIDKIRATYAARPTDNRTMYIEPVLDTIPLPIADRSSTVHDMGAALMGTRFDVPGDKVRLFMQWGRGLPAQWLDMDLSARIIYDNDVVDCSFRELTVTGAQHSGDIRQIPDQVGTAEYIELDIPALQEAGARYVAFTCNAYSNGELQPGLVVGWMDSAYPMTVSESTGVAYDPSTVQHQVRIAADNLSKGLLFGLLDVAARQILWIEMPFDGQISANLDIDSVMRLLDRLSHKATIGQLLRTKAEAQGLILVDDPAEADEAYTYQWALDSAAIADVLLS